MFSLRSPRTLIYIGFFFALGVAALILVAWLSWQVVAAIIAVSAPFLAGTFLALLIDPLVVWIERRGLSRMAAIVVVSGVVVVALVALCAFAVPVIITQAGNLSQSVPKFVTTFLQTHHKIGPVKLPKNFDALVAQVTGLVTGAVSGSSAGLQNLLLDSATTVIESVVTLIVTFYILIDVDRFRARIYFLTPRSMRWALRQYAADIAKVFSGYVRGLFTVCAAYGIVTILLFYGLSIVHHQLRAYALLIGVLGGILYSIPYLGPITIALLTFLVALAASGGVGFAFLAVGATLVINQVFDNVVTPKVVGGGVGLHPVVALLSLAVGGELFKVWGLLLAVPVAASIQIVLYRIFPRLAAETPRRFLSANRVADAGSTAPINPGPGRGNKRPHA